MLSITDYQDLIRHKSVTTPEITSPKNKVLRLKLRGLDIRCKITKNHMITIADTDDAFIDSMFPDHSEMWNTREERADCYVLQELVKYMRIRMELRRDIIDSGFADPAKTLRLLKLEHSTF
jgi:hypothetical protein